MDPRISRQIGQERRMGGLHDGVARGGGSSYPHLALQKTVISRSTLSRLQGKGGAGEMGYPKCTFETRKQMVFALFRLLSHV